MNTPNNDFFIPEYTAKYPSLLIFGAPGVGKGTLSKFLSGSGSLFHLSSGDVFRGLASDSPAGQLFHSYGKKGLLVPDVATISIVRNYINGLIATNRYSPQLQHLLLDGIPRTASQVEYVKPYIDVKKIIVLEVRDQEELIKRLHKRAKIEGRHDDADESILRTRMEVYEKETKQVLDQYPAHLIARFNAQQRPLEVAKDVLNQLSDILAYPPKS